MGLGNSFFDEIKKTSVGRSRAVGGALLGGLLGSVVAKPAVRSLKALLGDESHGHELPQDLDLRSIAKTAASLSGALKGGLAYGLLGGAASTGALALGTALENNNFNLPEAVLELDSGRIGKHLGSYGILAASTPAMVGAFQHGIEIPNKRREEADIDAQLRNLAAAANMSQGSGRGGAVKSASVGRNIGGAVFGGILGGLSLPMLAHAYGSYGAGDGSFSDTLRRMDEPVYHGDPNFSSNAIAGTSLGVLAGGVLGGAGAGAARAARARAESRDRLADELMRRGVF